MIVILPLPFNPDNAKLSDIVPVETTLMIKSLFIILLFSVYGWKTLDNYIREKDLIRIENDFFVSGLSEIIVRQQKEIDRPIEEIEIYKKLP